MKIGLFTNGGADSAARRAPGSTMRFYGRLWRRFIILALVREAEYRVSFFTSLLEGMAELAVAVLTFALLYQFTSGIAGWSAPEALVLVGVYRALDGLIALQVTPNMDRLTQYVGRGDLDFVLLRPVSSQFLVSLRWLRPVEATNILIGVALAVYAGGQAGARWSPGGVAAALFLAGCGLVLLYCLWFVIATCAFWLVRVEPLGYLFYDVWQAARYPVDYFKGPIRAILTFVLPVAFATTFPTRALLGVVDPRLLPLGLGLAAFALFLTNRFWQFALRRYSSASS